MNCSGCGAPLALNQPICPACGLHNAVDLLVVGEYRVLAERSRLQCPNGCGDLQLLQLGAGLDLAAGFCPHCKGLQFAPGAVQIALEKVAAQVREINHDRIAAILNERVLRERVCYRPCPACGEIMNRRAFNAYIPLFVDDCREHGTWLDGGEFTVLAEWMEAGGAQMAKQASARLSLAMQHGTDPQLAAAALLTRERLSSPRQAFNGPGDLPAWLYALVATLWLLWISGLSLATGIAMLLALIFWLNSRYEK